VTPKRIPRIEFVSLSYCAEALAGRPTSDYINVIYRNAKELFYLRRSRFGQIRHHAAQMGQIMLKRGFRVLPTVNAADAGKSGPFHSKGQPSNSTE